ncbi:MAG TPA: phage tail sheath C-terminal domain-containing protein [Anaerolineales bacterium]|nr:phage tail sheath C-terminal domain-containing protein [Anaerolineales bacterium]
MPEYLAPGVYIEEIATGAVPIEGVSTSTAGFVGPTERGPENARLITSWLEYRRWYGGYIPAESFLAYAVQGFFDNGGQRCFVARVVPNAAVAAQTDVDNLTFRATGRGTWGNNIAIKVDPAGQAIPNQNRFRVSIWYYREPYPPGDPDPTNSNAAVNNPNWRAPDAFEQFDNLTELEGMTNNIISVLNASSNLIRVTWNANGPAPLQTNGNITRLQNGAAGAALTIGDFDGDPNPADGVYRGLEAMQRIDEISLLCVPDEVHPNPVLVPLREPIRNSVLNQCELLRDRFAILSVDQGHSDIGAPPPGGLIPPRDTSYGAFYYPWIEIFDPVTNGRSVIPPTGHVAGIYARSDIERGVHKAPANEVVRGAFNMEFPVTKRTQDMLNPRGVNCIRDFRPDGRSIRVWGARTMSSDGQWKYVNVRRLFLFVEESIDEGTQWVVFEPNDEPLWDRVRRSITNFLVTIWRNGALMGATQEEAFFVKCDRTTMTQDDIDNGRLICYIGLAPVKPAEFVIFRFSQKTLEAQS